MNEITRFKKQAAKQKQKFHEALQQDKLAHEQAEREKLWASAIELTFIVSGITILALLLSL